MSLNRLILSLAALGLLAVSFHIPQAGQNVPGIGDRDFRGAPGK